MNWAELSYELGRVVLVRDFIGPSGLVRVVFGPSCPAPIPVMPGISDLGKFHRCLAKYHFRVKVLGSHGKS